MSKLKSRKLWVLIIGFTLNILNELFDLGLENLADANILGVGYLVAQGYVDGRA